MEPTRDPLTLPPFDSVAPGKRGVPRLLELAVDPAHTYVAIQELSNRAGKRAGRGLLRFRSHADPFIREAAAWGLVWLTTVSDGFTLADLVDWATDAAELPMVRGQVCEAIGSAMFGRDLRAASARRTVTALIGLAELEALPIRFWACYALANARSRRALPVLRHIEATDQRSSEPVGFRWPVSEEATSAIDAIFGRRSRAGMDGDTIARESLD